MKWAGDHIPRDVAVAAAGAPGRTAAPVQTSVLDCRNQALATSSLERPYSIIHPM